MLRRFVPFALLCLTATPAYAQEATPVAPAQPPAPAEAPAPKPATVRVTLQTSEGAIVLELEKERAPVTTANFLRYVDQKRLDGATFYRATKVAPGFGLIQGGARNDPKRVLPAIAHEPTTQTGLSHDAGVISMARNAPGTATGDFFITVGGAMPSMNATPGQPGDNLGFAAFGRVVEGTDVVKRILDAPTSPTEGEGVMRGQILAQPVVITAARRAD
ncbi:peptidyl-prolyl cis-trans isomerase A (cyclophilin A) [Sphingomonas laterariae]|uniref:peptidylprolyl isomerase n=1 Tax=Edaphosphingomonas laterariae TaxID=861865 RepID=A0A239DSP8_9SPHN|nr:peptidylprolyl isomerase [Sphingomonas laterariae]SNS35645.1 peptidyl-prolyl cis-trans isomerase A (cyclophilin A) [Sphingomonas laterariae]